MPEPSLQPSTRKARNRRTRRWIKRGVLAVGALAIIGGLVYAWMPRPVAVDIAAARRTSLEVVVEGDGRTRVRERFVVTSPITGTLERVELEPGDRVTATEPVAYVEPPDPVMLDERTRAAAEARIEAATAQQRQAATAITRARAARDVAVREASRVRKLVRANAVTVSELDRAELAEQVAHSDLQQAEAARAAATAELASARATLGLGVRNRGERIAIPAPASGSVLRVLRDSAGPIAAGAPLLEVGEPCDLEVVLDVLSSEAAQIEVGARALIENWGGDPLVGSVRRIEPSAFTEISALGIEEQRVNVVVSVTSPPERLGDGFRVEARIVIWRSDNVLAVPASALFRDRGSWTVYVVDAGVAKLRQVDVGHRGRQEIEVTRGLSDGEQVILHPGDRVTPGGRVTSR